jgi:hypothetical protein
LRWIAAGAGLAAVSGLMIMHGNFLFPVLLIAGQASRANGSEQAGG